MVKACGASIAKLVLFVVNAIFWLTGVFLLALGIWALLDSNFNQFWSGIAGGDLAGRIPNVKAISILIIVLGAVMFAFGFAGCCGACKESRCLLTIYIVLMGIVMAAEVAVSILAFVFRAKLPEVIQSGLKQDVRDHITGKTDNGGDTLKNTFNQFFLSLQFDAQCCGATDYRDYFNGSLYQYLNVSMAPSNPSCYAVPLTCCVRYANSTADWAHLNTSDVAEYDSCCSKTQQSSTGRYSTGCYTKVRDVLEKFTLPIAIGLIVFAVFQIVIMLSAVCLCQAIGQEERNY
jgi:tetraspanin-18